MLFKFFIGVDVSKNSLDIVVHKLNLFLFHIKIENNPKAIKKFFLECKKNGVTLSESLLCLEHTGIYNNMLLNIALDKNVNTWVEHGRQIKQSMGMVRGKNDKVDAKRIAEYAYRFQDKATLWKPERMSLQQLKQLVSLRKRLIKAKNQIKTPLKENQQWVDKNVIQQVNQIAQKSIKNLELQIKVADKKIKEIIQTDTQLARLFEIATSVNGVGPAVAHELIITTKEFTTIKDSKKFAAYAGIAPFDNQSGSSLNSPKRVSHMANKSVKKILHMAALSVISREGEMTQFYRRKVGQGKNKMLVINAIRNKIIQRVFACIRKNEKYDKNYKYNLA